MQCWRRCCGGCHCRWRYLLKLFVWSYVRSWR